MRILLTGSTGFLGSHLCRAFVSAGHEVAAVVRETSDTRRIADLLESVELVDCSSSRFLGSIRSGAYQVVVHTATDYGHGGRSASELLQTNVLFPLRILDALRSATLPARFVNTDSFFAKPGSGNQTLAAYTLGKEQLRQWLVLGSSGAAITNMRLEHPFGPQDSKSKFVPAMLERLLANEPEVALSPGDQERDFIYVSDVVDAYLTILERDPQRFGGFEEFEVGRGESLPLRSFVEMMKHVTGSESRLNFGALEAREGEIRLSCADTTALTQLGWRPTVSLERGLQRCVQALTKGSPL